MIIQGVLFSSLYPRLFSTARTEWIRSAAAFFVTFGLLAWSFVVLPVAAKYDMTSVSRFMILETAFTAVQFAVVSLAMALAWRDRKAAAK
jgi:hypothetical protein